MNYYDDPQLVDEDVEKQLEEDYLNNEHIREYENEEMRAIKEQEEERM